MTLATEVSVFFGELRSFLATVSSGDRALDYLSPMLKMCTDWKEVQISRGYDISLIEEQLAYTILPYLKEQMQSWGPSNAYSSCNPLFFDKMEAILSRNDALYPTGLTKLHLVKVWEVSQLPLREKQPFLYDLLRSAEGLSYGGGHPKETLSDLITRGFLQGTSYTQLNLWGLRAANADLYAFLMFTRQHPLAVEKLSSLSLRGVGSFKDNDLSALHLPALKTLDLSYTSWGNPAMSYLLQASCMSQLERLHVVGVDVDTEVYLEWGMRAHKTFEDTGVPSPLKVLDFGFWRPLAVKDKRTKVWRDLKRVFTPEVFPHLEIR